MKLMLSILKQSSLNTNRTFEIFCKRKGDNIIISHIQHSLNIRSSLNIHKLINPLHNIFVTVINDDMCFNQINILHLTVGVIHFASSQNRLHSLQNRILVKLYHILHIQ